MSAMVMSTPVAANNNGSAGKAKKQAAGGGKRQTAAQKKKAAAILEAALPAIDSEVEVAALRNAAAEAAAGSASSSATPAKRKRSTSGGGKTASSSAPSKSAKKKPSATAAQNQQEEVKKAAAAHVVEENDDENPFGAPYIETLRNRNAQQKSRQNNQANRKRSRRGAGQDEDDDDRDPDDDEDGGDSASANGNNDRAEAAPIDVTTAPLPPLPGALGAAAAPDGRAVVAAQADEGGAGNAATEGAAGGAVVPGADGEIVRIQLPEEDVDYEMEAVTCWPEQLRKVLEVLSNILEEVVLDIDSESIRICSHDHTNVAGTFMYLRGTAFDRFRCEQRIRFCVNIPDLHDYIRNGRGNNSIMTLAVARNNPENEITIKIRDPRKPGIEENKLKVYECESNDGADDDFEWGDAAEHSNVITMVTADLRDVVKNLQGSQSEDITIEVNPDCVTFTAAGDTGVKSQSLRPSSSLRILFKEHVKLNFKIKFLRHFARGQAINDRVHLYISSTSPLLICYQIWHFGELWFCLLPSER